MHRGPRPRGPIVGPRVTFYVSNRRLVPDLDIDEPFIVISVASPDRPEAVMMESPHLRDVLRLSFHDRAEQGDSDTMLFGEDQARQILDFVGQHYPAVKTIVTQCEKGNSRSAAIAAALSRIIQQDDEFIRQCFMPNRLVYTTLLKAAQSRGEME